jgi:hypothetical protein
MLSIVSRLTDINRENAEIPLGNESVAATSAARSGFVAKVLVAMDPAGLPVRENPRRCNRRLAEFLTALGGHRSHPLALRWLGQNFCDSDTLGAF